MNVMADISVTANFAINTYTLTYTAGANGSISGTSPQTVNYGENGTAVTAVPDSGYHFVDWSDSATENPRTDKNVTADITVTANFAINGGSNADLSDLAASAGPLSPAFDPGTTTYTVNVPFTTTSTTVTPTAADAGATITVDGNPVASGNPSGSISLNVGNNIITTVVTAADTTTMKTYTINVIRGGQVVVTGSTGADGSYATLKAAFDALNANGTQAGNVISVSITGDTTETATAALNEPSVSSWTSLTITPSGARTVSGAIAAGSPLINLNGADNVTIDGLNSAGNSLTISNTTIGATAGTGTIRLIADATNDTITRCTILGSSTSTLATAAGTIIVSTGTTTGNDNNTISNNDIGPAGINLPSKAIMASGTSAAIENDNVMITGNNIFDFFLPGSSCTGINILTGNEAWTISNNRFYQTATRTFTTTALRYSAITLNNSTGGFTVSGNTIGFGAANGTGTTTITGSSNEVRGIDAASVRTTAPATEIQNNTISGINQTTTRSSTTAANSAFIGVAMGTTDGLINATGNTIGSLDGSSTIVVNSTSTTANTAPVIGFYNFSFFDTNISSNNIGAITIQSTGTTVGFRGILVNTNTGLSATINNNTIGGAVAGGAITNTQVGNYAMYAIQCALPNLTATGNTIRNMNGNANGAVVTMSGIITSGSTGVNTISQNTVHSLTDTVTGGSAGAIYAIDCGFPVTANVVERNFVHSIKVNSTLTAYQIYGIIARTQGTATYKNNMIRLGLDAAGNSITTGFSIIGIRDSAGTTSANSYYYNSIYIGGTGVVSASNTYCMLSDVVTNTRNFVDNIFWNARSNASGGIANIAIRLGGTAPNPAGLTSNYNDLFVSGTDGAIGFFNSAVVPTFANWKTVTGQDTNSISANPQFVNPTGTAATVDLHINCASPADGAATPVAGITTDFDNETRDATTPDIGADEINLGGADTCERGFPQNTWRQRATSISLCHLLGPQGWNAAVAA